MTGCETQLDARWEAVSRRDAGADGTFWYSVKTTGVYCRPSCPSRGANPANVAFHESVEAARSAGFRACKRCNPDGLSISAQNAALVDGACRMIEAEDAELTLGALAQAADLSPGHFHRLFRAATGVTPKAYAAAHRANRLRQGLATIETITGAIYQSGFGSSGRFYAQSTAILGMTPSRYRAGGAGEVLRFAVGQCSLGAILVAASAKGVAAVLLGDDADALLRDMQDRFPAAVLIAGDADFEVLVARVVGLVEAPRSGIDLPLDVRGTAFQQKVWQALRDVPAGHTASYADIANAIGVPTAARAVAAACAANRIAVAIPCHRVVRTDGAISGYRWGVDRKRALLQREALT